MVEEIWTWLVSATDSEFFAGGVALGAMGILVASLRYAWHSAQHLLLKVIRSSVTIDNRSESYRHFLLWLNHNGVLNHVRNLSRIDPRHDEGTGEFAPAPGRYWFRYGGYLCAYSWHIDDNKKVGGSNNQGMLEVLTITIYFSSTATLLQWIDEGRRLARSGDRKGPGLYICRGCYWDHIGDVPKRGISSVISEDDRVEQVLDDMRWFYNSQNWYAQRCVPWRRGYLFFGPPGTGKSSLIRALASELGLDIATMDIGHADVSDDDLREAMLDAPQHALLAVEDIDAIFIKRDEKRTSGVSFSGLLNAIDGIGAQEGRALIMTTNHVEKLDPALIRPGRADMHVELGLVGADGAAKMFSRFFPEETELIALFRARIGNEKVTPSQLQGWLLLNADDPQKAAGADFLPQKQMMVTVERHNQWA